jgi:aerobic carbon-monoxide dehydrogenase medium subunit
MAFDYYEPATLPEAFAMMASAGESGAVLAGGTDLLLQMRRGLRSLRSIINIKQIPGLDELRCANGGGLRLGPLVTFRRLETDANVRACYPSLAEAATVVAGVQLRNLATVGGNIGNASPSADSIPPLVALDAVAEIAGPNGARSLPLADALLGPGRTTLAGNELFAGFDVPAPPARSGNAYQRLTPRAAMDIAVVSVAALVALDAGGRITSCRIALGAVSPVPLRAERAERELLGERLSPALLQRAGELAGDAVSPISDIRGSASYRRAMIGVLTRRVLDLAHQRAIAAAQLEQHTNGASNNGSVKARS